jgi:predicted N-formylglutamate amidohydrolase
MSSVATQDSPGALLGPDEPSPYRIINSGGSSALLLVCDHASNRIPATLGDLGLSAADRERHIAWDIGAARVTEMLSELLDAQAILSGYSRLVIDPNRSLLDQTAVPALSDGTLVPGNLSLSQAAREQRAEALYWPYHNAVSALLEEYLRRGEVPALVSIHSFTPVMYGLVRPWDMGFLWDKDPRLAVPLIRELCNHGTLRIGDNEPYSGRYPADFTVDYHGERSDLPHVGVEIRQDHLADEQGQERMARVLAGALEVVLDELVTVVG